MSQPVSATLLDVDALDRLRELDPSGKSRLLERVLRAFESSASRLAQQFGEARNSDDMQGIRHVVHTLKSSSASIGALELARLCAEIEAIDPRSRLSTACRAPRAMDRETAAVLQALNTQLSPTVTPT